MAGAPGTPGKLLPMRIVNKLIAADVAITVSTNNPKSGESAARFDGYAGATCCTRFLELGGTKADLQNGIVKRHVKIVGVSSFEKHPIVAALGDDKATPNAEPTAKMVNVGSTDDGDVERRKMSEFIRGLASSYVDTTAACSRVCTAGDGAAARRVTSIAQQRATKRSSQASLAAPNVKRRRTGYSSKYWGVVWFRGAWNAQYKNEEGRRLHIGYFAVEEDAARAYDSTVHEAGVADIRPLNLKNGVLVEKPVRPLLNITTVR